MINTLESHYQTVIDHISIDVQTLKQSGDIADTVSLKQLQKRVQWLEIRKSRLNEQRETAFNELRKRLDAYLSRCEEFWKEMNGKTYEERLDYLWETKIAVTKLYALSGFDAYYGLFVTLKQLRNVLPVEESANYEPALQQLEGIKKVCVVHLRTYLTR